MNVWWIEHWLTWTFGSWNDNVGHTVLVLSCRAKVRPECSESFADQVLRKVASFVRSCRLKRVISAKSTLVITKKRDKNNFVVGSILALFWLFIVAKRPVVVASCLSHKKFGKSLAEICIKFDNFFHRDSSWKFSSKRNTSL